MIWNVRILVTLHQELQLNLLLDELEKFNINIVSV